MNPRVPTGVDKPSRMRGMSTILSAQELATRVKSGFKQTILASLWAPNEGGGYTQYITAHIPTARFCDTAKALASVPSSKTGRNPLPTASGLDLWFREWGLTEDREVIVYDNHRGLYAARAWWILRWAGVKNVRILDGGQQAWEALGEAVMGGPGNPQTDHTLKANPGQMPTATLEDVKAHTGMLVDCREPNRYAGRKEFLDLMAGHIPGAINIPAREVVNDDRTFKSADELKALFDSHGVTADVVDDIIIYSGSGNHSAQVIAAMEIAGLPAPRHFVGGWSQWCADPKNPVEIAV